MKVTICIPTFERPAFLKIALESCLGQTRPPDEILIGDDSRSDETEAMIRQEFAHVSAIRYDHRRPGLGERRNIDDLFRRATGDAVMLLHDDDWILPNCLRDLAAVLEQDASVIAVFGKQKVADDAGRIDERASLSLNDDYFRTSDRAGVHLDPLRSAFIGQLPNNGYLMRGDIARRMGYYTALDCKQCSDHLFGVQFGLKAKELGDHFQLVDHYTVGYRISHVGLSRSGQNLDGAYASLELMRPFLGSDSLSHSDVDRFLESHLPVVVMAAARMGHCREAFDWYFHPRHRSRILTLGGLHRLWAILKHGLLTERVVIPVVPEPLSP